MFTDALETEGLMDAVTVRLDGLARIDVGDDARPVLLAVSDNGPQMTSGATREWMAMVAIAQHYNGVRLSPGVAYVTPNDEHEGRGPAIRQARKDGWQMRMVWV